MASGDPLFLLPALCWAPTATLAAQYDIVVGTSSPAEWWHVLAFDGGTIEYADCQGLIMPAHYAGGGVTASVRWSSGSATNNVQWALAFREIAEAAEDLDTTAHTYSYQNTGTITVPGTQGHQDYAPITFTNGAQMDNVAAGDSFSLRLRRDATTDSNTIDAYFYSLLISET